MVGKTTIGTVRLDKGIMQGDALSPLLFVLALEPLSRLLNKYCDKVSLHEGEMARNHLIFIDDIKLMAKDESTLNDLCIFTKKTLDAIGFQINDEKSANNMSGDDVLIGRQIDDVDGYKYLGIC